MPEHYDVDRLLRERRESASHWRVVEEIALPPAPDVSVERGEQPRVIRTFITDLARDPAAVDAVIEAHRRGWIRVDTVERRGRDALMLTLIPIADPPNALAHLTTIDQFTGNHDHVVWGDRALPALTYLQTPDFVVEGNFENAFMVALGGRPEQFVRLDIDTAVLQQYRNTYVDPEALTDTPEEFGHSFAVHGGVPWRAITAATVIEVPARPEEFWGNTAIEIPTAEDIRRMTAVNRQRIDAWLQKLDRAA